MKKQNGITLIALIITIIVLLILAVVTIGAVQDSDIIGHAENATTKYNAAVKHEEDLLENYVSTLDKVTQKSIAEIIKEKMAYIQANQSEYTYVATDSTYSVEWELWMFTKALNVVEDELGFTISNRDENLTTYTYNGTEYMFPTDESNIICEDGSVYIPIEYSGESYTIRVEFAAYSLELVLINISYS